jgi:alkanesulfonate monooxygenase SsuD/methylene tetrahydromethanopterin reductase-like flavin-dependent oxidoreductase (luciferase family)
VAVRPVPQAAPEAVLEDLQLVRRAWGSDPVHHASARRQVDGVEIHPKPAQPAGPPLWIRGEPGREALAVLLAIRAGAGLLVESIEAARSLLAASSRGAAVPQRLAVVVAAPDEDRAGRAPAALERARSARITGAVRFDSLDWAEAVRFDSITSSVGCEGARSL